MLTAQEVTRFSTNCTGTLSRQVANEPFQLFHSPAEFVDGLAFGVGQVTMLQRLDILGSRANYPARDSDDC